MQFTLRAQAFSAFAHLSEDTFDTIPIHSSGYNGLGILLLFFKKMRVIKP